MSKKTKVLFFLVLISGSFGCFQNKEKELVPISSSPSLEKTEQKAFNSNLFAQKEIPSEWWKIFADSQLDALIEKGLLLSPTLKKAETKIVEAQASAKSVRSRLFPTLYANAEDNWQYLSKYGFFRDFFPTAPGVVVPSKFNEIDLSLNFSYELDFFGKNQKMLKSALGLALAEEMEKEEAKLILCTAIAFAYFQWQTHFAELILLSQKVSAEKQLVQLSTSRYKEGLDNITAKLHTEKELGKLSIEILNLEKEIEIDEFFLKNLIGEGPEAKINLVFAWNPGAKQAYLPGNLNLDLLAQRPDVRAQIWRVEAARQDIGVAKTEFYPNANLIALAGLSSLTFSHLLDWASRIGSLNPAIHLPLFTGGKLEANLKGKEALFNEAVYDYNTLLLKAAQEVSTEITNFLSIEKQLALEKEQIHLQKNLFDVATSRFKQGLDIYASTLYSKIELLSEEIYEVHLKQYKIFTLIRMIKALGGGFSKEEIGEARWNP